jgi:hypothetical protein
MAVRMADALKNTMLDAYETAYGTSPKVKIYTGSVHASIGTAPAGTWLVTVNAPSDWQSAAASGSKALTGTWSGTAVATGTAGCYTFTKSDDTILEDGAISTDMTLNNTSIASGQTVTVTTWTKSI